MKPAELEKIINEAWEARDKVSFKTKGKVIEYAKEENVLTFKQFFREEIATRRKPRWVALGAW